MEKPTMEKAINDLIQLGAALAKLDEGRKEIEALFSNGGLGRIQNYVDTLPLPAGPYFDDLYITLCTVKRHTASIKLVNDLFSGNLVKWR